MMTTTSRRLEDLASWLLPLYTLPMQRTRFLMIGGFLGAGKTTAIARLAKHYTDAGLRVGLVTNDQAFGLVDTRALQAQGFHVGEVAGACFCCKFDDLVDTMAKLSRAEQPDMVLAEPVGSCTDLVATVIEPLRHLHGDRYELAPLVVLCKPEHGKKILTQPCCNAAHGATHGASSGFSPKAEYIFRKQLEESQIITLNKVDKLTTTARDELLQRLAEHFPDKRILATSSRTGAGFEELLEALASPFQPAVPAMAIDYDTYAEGEAELGWLNCTVNLTASSRSFQLDGAVEQLASLLCTSLLQSELEPGHVKLLASSGSTVAIANWVASDAPVELSLKSEAQVHEAELLINARVAGDPVVLTQIVRHSLDKWAELNQFVCEITHMQHFRPSRPVPVHRYTE